LSLKRPSLLRILYAYGSVAHSPKNVSMFSDVASSLRRRCQAAERSMFKPRCSLRMSRLISSRISVPVVAAIKGMADQRQRLTMALSSAVLAS
jgi:hypothetical protein